MGHGISNLGSPASVTVDCEMVLSALLRRNGISEIFDIGGVRVVDIHVNGLLGVGQEGYDKVVGGVDIL